MARPLIRIPGREGAPASRTRNLFFGLPLGGDLAEALGRWQGAHPGVGGWSPPAGLHLTLAFLGPRPTRSLPTLKDLAAALAARHRAFALETVGLGSFSNPASARLLWLGLAPCPALEALVEDLRGSLRGAGETFDARPFHPHVTLARFRQARPLAGFAEAPGGSFPASRLLLLESRGRGSYLELGAWNLREV